jgi:iron complex transport system substrate-binding protein
MRAWALIAVALLAGCGGSDAGPAPAGARVVSLHDVTTEMVVALGAADRLVGVAEPVDTTPAVARAIARVARVGGLETILPLRPEVVLGLGVVAEQDPELVRRLRAAGIDVHLADPAALEDVHPLTRAVAERVGANRASSEALVAELRARGRARAVRPTGRVRVFVYDCCDPPFTAGGKTVLSDLVARAGGQNIFADLDADWTHASWEEVVARRPELVVVHAYRHEGQGDVPAKRRALRAIEPLRDLPVAVLPLGCSLGGLRSAEAVERIALAIERGMSEPKASVSRSNGSCSWCTGKVRP